MEQNEQNYLDALKAKLNEELEQVRSHAKWYKQNAYKNQRNYYLLRIPVITLGVVLPSLVAYQSAGRTLDFLTALTIGISLIIAILTSFDTFFQFGKSWIDERTAELELYKVIRKYERQRLQVDAPMNIKQSIDVAEKIVLSLQQEYEQIVGKTVNAFMKRSVEIESHHPTIDNPR